MRRCSATLVAAVAVVGLLPVSVEASSIDLLVSGRELSFAFGLVPFRVAESVASLDSAPGLVNGMQDGFMSLTSGPLLSLTVVTDPIEEITYSTYVYGPGRVSVSGVWQSDDRDVFGRFTASTDGFTLTVCEGCYVLGGGEADDLWIYLGAGHLDRRVAHMMGVSTRTVGGSFVIGPEDINEDPSTAERVGFSNTGAGNLSIETTVPEPSLAVLLLAAATAGAARQRRRRAASRAARQA